MLGEEESEGPAVASPPCSLPEHSQRRRFAPSPPRDSPGRLPLSFLPGGRWPFGECWKYSHRLLRFNDALLRL
ncbi:hypothetical protein RJT34_14177 [Clitoria ternatea]|uniref:Uncharacterized protein n=1 Tax=Clitoria ternatea TaxID=43366 RepID=A0AAN9PMF0_CLITE